MAKRAKVRKMKTHIERLDEAKKLMQELGDAAADVLDQAAKSGAEIVLAEAKKKAPVDTGTLRDSLLIKKSRLKNAHIKSQYYVTKKSGVNYFAPVELGTSKMKAQPFLRPAVDENTKIVAKTINAEILKAIGRIK
ncbi:MAG: HK97 gp10 family phage protein [Dethiobacter sp.]|jgi:HK97 gp10 family phage protein|nr:HK97 gp10 family phage protein [Dethiobacter sp.]